MNTEICFLCVCVCRLEKKKFKVSTAQIWKQDTQDFRERMVPTLNRKKLLLLASFLFIMQCYTSSFRFVLQEHES